MKFPQLCRRLRVTTMMVAVLIVGTLVGLGTRAVRQAREAANASSCLCDRCAIKLALLNDHDAYGRFPPAGPEGEDLGKRRAP